MGVSLTLGDAEEYDPSPDRLQDVVGRLEEFAGPEGFGVSLTDSETEWSLCAFVDGRVSWMNLSCEARGYGQPRHLTGVPRGKVLELWSQLASGHQEAVEAEPWRTGHGPGAEQGTTADGEVSP
jgi:hypothetical protein